MAFGGKGFSRNYWGRKWLSRENPSFISLNSWAWLAIGTPTSLSSDPTLPLFHPRDQNILVAKTQILLLVILYAMCHRMNLYCYFSLTFVKVNRQYIIIKLGHYLFIIYFYYAKKKHKTIHVRIFQVTVVVDHEVSVRNRLFVYQRRPRQRHYKRCRARCTFVITIK